MFENRITFSKITQKSIEIKVLMKKLFYYDINRALNLFLDLFFH
jgi:hypothetical protein